jgi:hypothetical protein
MYDTNQTEASKGALVELALALELYRDDFVLAGGWAPYILTKGYVEHCGSIDIDLVLRPSIVVRYESIRNLVLGLGYMPTRDPFKFERELKALDRKPFLMSLDFLTEPEAREHITALPEVQKDLQAVFILGCSIVLTHNTTETIEGKLPSGADGAADIKVSDIVGALAMKGLALGRPRKLEKDSYDIYVLAGFHGGNPYAAADRFNERIEALSDGVLPEVATRALRRIRTGFGSPNSYASLAVSRFMEQNVSVDASERVSTFLSRLKPSP